MHDRDLDHPHVADRRPVALDDLDQRHAADDIDQRDPTAADCIDPPAPDVADSELHDTDTGPRSTFRPSARARAARGRRCSLGPVLVTKGFAQDDPRAVDCIDPPAPDDIDQRLVVIP